MLAVDQGSIAPAQAWVSELRQRLDAMGGIGMDKVEAEPVAISPMPGRLHFFDTATGKRLDASSF